MSEYVPVEILLAEDNPTDAEMTIRALERGHLANGIKWVKDGEEALNYMLFRSSYVSRPGGNPRLILLDLKMPKLDGIDVLRVLKADPVCRLVPVVMLTSSSDENDIVNSYNLGVNSYIVKPIDFDKFVEEVSKLGMYWTLMNKVPER